MSPKWNRILTGILAALFVVAGLVIGATDSWGNLWCGSFIRAGALLGAFWIGMPTKGRAAAWANFSPTWILAGALGLVLFMRVVQRPQVLIPLISTAAVLIWVWPWLTGSGRPRR